MLVPSSMTVGIRDDRGEWRAHLLSKPSGPTLCAVPTFPGDPEPVGGTEWNVEDGSACETCVLNLVSLSPALRQEWAKGTLRTSELS